MNAHLLNYIIAHALIGIILFSVGLFVLIKDFTRPLYRRFFIYNALISWWGIFTVLMQFSPNSQVALLFDRIELLAIVFIPVASLHFTLEYLQKTKQFKKLITFVYFISILFFSLTFTPLIAKDVSRKGFITYFTDPGVVYLIFVILFSTLMTAVVIIIYKSYKIEENKIKKQGLLYFLIATLLATMGGGANFLVPYNILIPILIPYGTYAVVLYGIITAYVILRYRLMDITVAITRTGIFVAVYTLVLGLPFALAIWLKSWLVEIFHAAWWMLPLGLMALLATVGPFIYIYLQRKAEERLLKEQKRYQETLKQASIGMTRIRNLRKLLDLIAHIVTKTVRISYAGIYLYDEEANEYILQVSRDKGRMPIPKLDSDNPLITQLALKHQPLVYEEVKLQMQDSDDDIYKQLEENMRLLTASVVIPCFLEDNLTGIIVLGEKISGQIYTPEDLNVFQVLASQAALAIENAKFYEETKKMQEQIAQAEKMATIGTMADGLSHQINNRFYALSLIAGDTIDTIKMTDTSKCTSEVKEMIHQINYALERIQTNVMQGGEVVRGLLKYSREGDTGLEALDLNTLLNNTLEMVQFKVKLSEIDIIRDFSNNTPKIKGNMTQLEEAFFNFIDNAYDAIVERRTLLKEKGYRGRITISATPKDHSLEIVVEDNGIGVKEEDAKKVFTPFFTTKTSSRKGTGLGLYVIKRIITDTHKGKVAFESDYKIGTRFIVELPIAG